MPDDGIERTRDPARLPVYKHLSSVLMFIGLGVLAIRSAEVGLGVLALLGAALFLVLAIRSLWIEHRRKA